MREKEELHLVYTRRSQTEKVASPEKEIERIYGLYHAKLKPRRLWALSIVNACMVLLLVMGLTVGVLVLPKPTESLTEKRPLATRPDFSLEGLFSGAYAEQMRTYIADTFPLRENFVRMAAVLDQSRGVRVDDVRVVAGGGNEPVAQPIASDSTNTSSHHDSGGMLPSVSSASVDTASQASEEPIFSEGAASETAPTADSTEQPTTEEQDASGTVYNGIFITQGRAMSLFGGNIDAAKRYANVVSSYQQALPDVQVYDMVVPTSAEFYLPAKYASMSNSEKDIIDTIYDSLDSKVRTVNAYDAIDAHQDEYLYFRTDHHWTGLGAYYAYTAFCQSAGLTPVPLEQMETRRLSDFIGTMYSQSQDSTLLENPDYVDYYLMQTDYTALRYDRGSPYMGKNHTLWGEYAQSPNSYSVFLQGDFPLIHVTTEHKNGKKLLMVKESFGNAFAPFLLNHYQEIFIVDQRYFELPMTQFIQENDIGELLFLNNAFAACTTYHINSIANLTYGNLYVPPTAPEPQPAASSEPEPKVTRLGRGSPLGKNNKIQSDT